MDVVFPHFVYDHTHGVFPWNTSDRIGILQFPSIYHRSVIYSRYVMYQSTLKQSPSEHIQSAAEHNVADFFNIMALVMSLLQLLSSPLFIATISVLKLAPGAEDVAKERTIDLAKMGFLWFLAYLMFFLPILSLEIIHFCPILFEYYM